MSVRLAELIWWAGIGQAAILAASALVPFRLDWRGALRSLPQLHRQMYWVYGGYVGLSIVAFAVICLANAEELAAGGGLARSFCAYAAVFWGVRLGLQFVFDVKPHLTTWWLVAGYHTLSLLFVAITAILTWAALAPRA